MNDEKERILEDIQTDLTDHFVLLLDRIKRRCTEELGWSEQQYNWVVFKWMLGIVKAAKDKVEEEYERANKVQPLPTEGDKGAGE